MTTFLVLLLLILINALYVAAEFAAVGARKSRVRRLADDGNRLARQLLPFLEDARSLDTYIAACQIGITLTSLLLGAFGQARLTPVLSPLMADWWGLTATTALSTASIIILVILTASQMVIGELVPKTLALQFPTACALITVKPMRWSLIIFGIFIKGLNGSGLLLLKMVGLETSSHRHIHSPDEIEMMIAESRDGGLLEADEHQRLRQALRLSARPVRQVMVPRPMMEALDIELPIDVALRKIADSPYTRLPVYRGARDNIVGVVHTKDVVMRWLEKGKLESLEAIVRHAHFVPDSVTADRLLPQLQKSGNQQALVVDEYGGVEGLVTLEDVLSEILGEVTDELKTDQPQPERLGDGRVRLPGLMRLDEAEPWIGILWQGDADTISGHVIECLGRLPVRGDILDIQGVTVIVEEMSRHVVRTLIATPVAKEEPAVDE